MTYEEACTAAVQDVPVWEAIAGSVIRGRIKQSRISDDGLMFTHATGWCRGFSWKWFHLNERDAQIAAAEYRKKNAETALAEALRTLQLWGVNQ